MRFESANKAMELKVVMSFLNVATDEVLEPLCISTSLVVKI